jgi:oligopeptide/dipeptide ABC transporter ATP-binding protein
MYKGVLMEEVFAKNLYQEAMHPYTKLLFKEVPNYSAQAKENISVNENEINRQNTKINSCPFYDRCPNAMDKCKEELPELKLVKQFENHKVRCHLL